MRVHLKCVLFAAASLGLAACGEVSDPEASRPTITEPSFARVPTECSTSDLATLSRSYFSNPAQQTAGVLLRDMEGLCATAPATAGETIAKGWDLLGLMESVLEAGTGGSPATGALLANGVMQYMCDVPTSNLCSPSPFDEVQEGAFGPNGLFAVKAVGATTPAVARAAVPFVDYDNVNNGALWGIEIEGSFDWQSALRRPGSKVLAYGEPAPYVGEYPGETIEELWYELHTFPNVPRFADGALHVGVCYSTPLGFPHYGIDDEELLDRIHREGNILEKDVPGFPGCAATATAGFSGLFGGLASVVDAMLPRPILAAFFRTDRKAPGSGGTPIDFSHFGLSAVQAEGELAWEWDGDEPDAEGEYRVGDELGGVTVRAFSASGIPFEHVTIEIYVAGNAGTPAGATVCTTDSPSLDPNDPAPTCDDGILVDPTQEQPDGKDPFAYFPNVTVNKPGGFRLCARGSYGTDPDLTFTEVCTGLFNVKNDG